MTITKSPYICNPDILFCHEARSTRLVTLDFGEADMLPAGTLISCEGKAVNDLTALGVLLYDVYKGYGSGKGVVLISGHVDLAKAQEHSGLTYSSEAKAALKSICFVGDTLAPALVGETTTYGGTITWDGNTEGLVGVGDMFYKVSDTIPTLEDLANGGTFSVAGTIVPFANFYENTSGILTDNADNGLALVVTEDNAEGGGMVFPEKGIYFAQVEAEGMFVEFLTINGYTGFETTEIKTIDPKYLPEDYIKQLIAEVTGS